jgi:hypothetical protein
VGKYEADIRYADLSKGKQFWYQGDFALWHLVYNNFQSTGFNAIGGAPSDTGGVDLHSFVKAAQSFDQAGNFFTQHTETLKQWLDSLGSENPAWMGKAADVFWHLIDDLHRKYENFASELRPPGFQPTNTSVAYPGYQSTTLHGDSLIGAEVALHDALANLYAAHYNFYWQKGSPIPTTQADGSQAQYQPPADPRDILNHIMGEIASWVATYNAPNVNYRQGGYTDEHNVGLPGQRRVGQSQGHQYLGCCRKRGCLPLEGQRRSQSGHSSPSDRHQTAGILESGARPRLEHGVRVRRHRRRCWWVGSA